MRRFILCFGLIGFAAACTVASTGSQLGEELTGSIESPLAVSTYMLRGLGGKCFTASGTGTGTAGTRIVLSDCNEGPNQRVAVSKVGDAYELRMFGLCVDVKGSNFVNGTPIQLWTCNASSAQRFTINGDLIIPKAAPKMTIEVDGGFTTNGTPIELQQGNLTASQAWKFVPVGIAPSTVASVSLTSSSIPGCTPDELAVWDRANVNEGALVANPDHEMIGRAYSNSGDTYSPLTSRRETFCGAMSGFVFNSDDDWNIHLEPEGPPFVKMLSDWSPNRKTLEAEIGVDKRYWKSSPWFKTSDQSALAPPFAAGKGHPACAYGAFVADEGHDGEGFESDRCDDEKVDCGIKPEIHPAEFVYWRDRLPAYFVNFSRQVKTDYLTILHMQDNSERFDDWDDFGGTSNAPQNWEPWSNSPVRGLVRIPWSYTPGGATTEMRIVDDFSANIVTSGSTLASNPDEHSAAEQTLAVDGRIVLRVSETTQDDKSLGVRIRNPNLVCRRPGSTEILGLVSIRNDLGGNDDHDNEGTHVLFVAKSTVTSTVFQPIPFEVAR